MGKRKRRLQRFRTDASESEVREIIREVAETHGLHIHFDQASNPLLIVHVTGSTMSNEDRRQKTDVQMGNVSGSNIGSIGRARDLHQFIHDVKQSSLDDNVKDVLTRARSMLDELELADDDKADVAGDLDKLADEAQQASPRKSRVDTLIERISVIAPAVAKILASLGSMLH